MRRRRMARMPRRFALAGAFALTVLAATQAATSARAAGSAPPLARGPAATEVLSYDRSYELAALWREAVMAGWGDEDAVILLERHEETWTADGRRIEAHHRIIRLATDLAVESYADLRIPYDSLRTTLTVQALRTYRDGQWIESGPTAQVEVTPDALERAPDYSYRRERMLLHDGIEVPCVVETAWTIEDRSPFRGGISGVEVFRRLDPVVQADLHVTAPIGVRVTSSGGLEEPQRAVAGESGDTEVTWSLRMLPSVTSLGEDPGAGFPSAHWSTWRDGSELGTHLQERFLPALVLNDAQRDTLHERLRDVEVETEIARRVAELVADKTRLVDYPDDWDGLGPRAASRTWETGYGTALDRAVLAAALLKEVGLGGEPVFVARSFAGHQDTPDGLESFLPIRLLVVRPGAHSEWLGIYEPSLSTFLAGWTTDLRGRMVWRPAEEPVPQRGGTGSISVRPRQDGLAALFIDLRFDGETSAWVGSGVYRTEGSLCRFGEMEGLANQGHEWLGSVVGGVLSGSKITEENSSTFDPSEVVAGFGLTVEEPKPDSRGRDRLLLGSLPGGVRSLLPADFPLHREAADREIVVPGSATQAVKLRLVLPEDRVVRLPEPLKIDNAAGTFELTVEREGDTVTITRRLNLNPTGVPAAPWADLRVLLLAEEHDRNRVLLYRAEADEAD